MHRRKCIGLGQPIQHADVELCGVLDLRHGCECTKPFSRRDNAMGIFLSHAFDLAKAEPHGRAGMPQVCLSGDEDLRNFAIMFKRAIPFAGIDVDRPNFHAMLARIAVNLRGA